MQQVLDNQNLFGGINVLLAGDFMKLPPTKRLSFPSFLINDSISEFYPDDSLEANTFDRIGNALFAHFTRYHLTEQHRTDDEKHFEFITKMSEGKELDIDND